MPGGAAITFRIDRVGGSFLGAPRATIEVRPVDLVFLLQAPTTSQFDQLTALMARTSSSKCTRFPAGFSSCVP